MQFHYLIKHSSSHWEEEGNSSGGFTVLQEGETLEWRGSSFSGPCKVSFMEIGLLVETLADVQHRQESRDACVKIQASLDAAGGYHPYGATSDLSRRLEGDFAAHAAKYGENPLTLKPV